MILTNTMANITTGEAGIYALLGYALVFLGLASLMAVVMLVGNAFISRKTQPAPVAVQPAAPAPEAPGSAGRLKLYNVDPKTAAMLMAIVADKMGKPINELRFLSIKEVTE